MNDRLQYPERQSYGAERKFYADTTGPQCPKCGGRCPNRVCRICGQLPRVVIMPDGTRFREVSR